jgi:hypothetical protein
VTMMRMLKKRMVILTMLGFPGVSGSSFYRGMDLMMLSAREKLPEWIRSRAGRGRVSCRRA